jgi:hypothetical protein
MFLAAIFVAAEHRIKVHPVCESVHKAGADGTFIYSGR